MTATTSRWRSVEGMPAVISELEVAMLLNPPVVISAAIRCNFTRRDFANAVEEAHFNQTRDKRRRNE